MRKSKINQLISHFIGAFASLRIDVPPLEVERFANLIHTSMDSGRRDFHTTRHILDVCESLSPITTLAALFHDLVYFQIDDGFPKATQSLLEKFVIVNYKGEVFIRTRIEDELFSLCLEVFGFHLGQKLSFYSGLNEFLSAFVAAKELRRYLSTKQIVAIIACIEGTIPFREDKERKSCFEFLEMRVRKVEEKFGLGLTNEEIETIIHQAVALANRDIINFADEDPGKFLDNTWILLPETNAFFWSVNIYSIRNYRQAMVKMEGFMNFLNPDSVFHHYKNVPDQQTFLALQEQTRKNVNIARNYLGIKLLTIAIIEALAAITGGDAPLSMFLGDVQNEREDTLQAKDYLGEAPECSKEYDEILMSLLEFGRASETSFDTRNSPLSAFIYKILGTEETLEHIQLAKDMASEKISAREFLAAINPHIVKVLATVCAQISLSRRDALLQYIAQMEQF